MTGADCEFPLGLKSTNVSPVLKKSSRLKKKKYCLISNFPNLSKVF